MRHYYIRESKGGYQVFFRNGEGTEITSSVIFETKQQANCELAYLQSKEDWRDQDVIRTGTL